MKHIWRIILEEPYRLFFPLGMLAAIYGVMMWPMLYAGWLGFHPGEAHSRLMIEGFMGAFVLGFLGTAFPRLTGNRPWYGFEFCTLLSWWLLCVLSHAIGHVPAGDAAFSIMLTLLLTGMIGRWVIGRRDMPPPGFVLALAGILGGAIAAGFLAGNPNPSGTLWQWARLWLFQGFLLLPLMGIGPYLLPRFYGMESSHSFDDSPSPPAGWWKKAITATIAGLMVVISFALEVHGHPLAGPLLRAAVVLLWFALETPVFQFGKTRSTPGTVARWALIAVVIGITCAAIRPLERVGSLHLSFAAGLGLITLAVGTRVILGHAGRHDMLTGKIVWLRWVMALLIVAALTRMTSDFVPAVRFSHHIYAAWAWAAGGLLWLIAVTRHLFRNEDSPGKPTRCPRRSAGRKGQASRRATTSAAV